MLLGIDVSNYQGDVDWNAVSASGRAFAFAKASEGINFTDKFFNRNWSGMKAAGLVRGAYHFGRPSVYTPEEEAAHFLSVVEAAGGVEDGDILVLDLEDTDVAADADLTDWTTRWLNVVEQSVGFKPVLYSGWWYLEPHIHDVSIIEPYHWWLAAYGDTLPTGATIWQFSDKEDVPGVNGPCDGDQFEGTIDELRAIGQGVVVGQPPSTSDTWQTCIDVVNGWGTRLGHTLSAADQLQASKELLSVVEMLKGLRGGA